MESLGLSKNEMNEFNIIQKFSKRSIGVSNSIYSKPIFKVLKIEFIQQLFQTYKMFFLDKSRRIISTNVQIFSKL